MTTVFQRPYAHVTVSDDSGDVEVAASSGDVLLDAMGVPYAEATVVLSLDDVDQLEQIDAREDQRVIVHAGDIIAGTERTFDLGLREREVDHKAKIITLRLASDEALLRDYAAILEDVGARAHEGSLRAVCDYVLAKIGASLAPGADDADVTAAWEVTNYAKNSAARSNADGYAAGTGTSSIGRHTDILWEGLPTIRFSAAGTGEAYLNTPTQASARPGQTWTYSYYLLSSGVQRPARTLIRFKGASGELVAQRVSLAITPAGAWTRIAGTAVAPPGTTVVEAFATTVSNAAGQPHYTSGHLLTEGVEGVLPWFDGESTLPGYTVEWDYPLDTSASTATRTPDVERDPGLFIMRAGVTAWEFLEPLTSTAGLRLFCDEQRVWRLIDPTTYTRPGRLSLAGWNVAEGGDVISRENPDVYATGVIVRYRWRDADGVAREAYDAAGDPALVYVRDIARPYPGPGAAAAILVRRQGQGRLQKISALASWITDPGMEASISLPGTYDQVGRVQSVRWQLGPSSRMEIGTRGLTEITPGSIAASLGTIDAAIGSIDTDTD